MSRLIAVLLTLFISTAVLAETLRTHQMHYRQASDVAEQIRTLYPAHEVRIAAQGSLLSVRASESVQIEIEQLLKQLDVPAQQYIIRLRESPSGGGSFSHHGASGVISNNGSKVTVTTGSFSTSTRGSQEKSVRVSEGELGFLGETRTLLVRGWRYEGGRFLTTEAIPLEAGLLVQPQSAGDDQVTLRLQNQTFADDPSRPSQIRTAGVSSTLTVRLGDWTPVGGTSMTNRSSQDSWTSSTRSSMSEGRDVEIRVDRVN